MGRAPAPLESIVRERANGLPVPGHDKIEGCRIPDGHGGGAAQQELLGTLALAVPLVLPREGPHGIAGSLGVAVLFNQACGERLAHRRVDGCGVFAAQAERFQQALPHRRDMDAELAETVGHHCACHCGVRGGLVLDDFEGADARALNALAGEVLASVGRRPSRMGAREMQLSRI
jgi:hypothetical protein